MSRKTTRVRHILDISMCGSCQYVWRIGRIGSSDLGHHRRCTATVCGHPSRIPWRQPSMRPSRRQQVTGRALVGRGPSFRLLDVLAGKNLGTRRTDFIVKLSTSRPTTHPHSRFVTAQVADADSPGDSARRWPQRITPHPSRAGASEAPSCRNLVDKRRIVIAAAGLVDAPRRYVRAQHCSKAFGTPIRKASSATYVAVETQKPQWNSGKLFAPP